MKSVYPDGETEEYSCEKEGNRLIKSMIKISFSRGFYITVLITVLFFLFLPVLPDIYDEVKDFPSIFEIMEDIRISNKNEKKRIISFHKRIEWSSTGETKMILTIKQLMLIYCNKYNSVPEKLTDLYKLREFETNKDELIVDAVDPMFLERANREVWFPYRYPSWWFPDKHIVPNNIMNKRMKKILLGMIFGDVLDKRSLTQINHYCMNYAGKSLDFKIDENNNSVELIYSYWEYLPQDKKKKSQKNIPEKVLKSYRYSFPLKDSSGKWCSPDVEWIKRPDLFFRGKNLEQYFMKLPDEEFMQKKLIKKAVPVPDSVWRYTENRIRKKYDLIEYDPPSLSTGSSTKQELDDFLFSLEKEDFRKVFSRIWFRNLCTESGDFLYYDIVKRFDDMFICLYNEKKAVLLSKGKGSDWKHIISADTADAGILIKMMSSQGEK